MHSKFGIFARLCKISSCRRVFQLCLGQGVFWEVMMLLINIISPPPCVYLMTILLEVDLESFLSLVASMVVYKF